MKSIVTGGSGFIGSHLVDRLLAENHEVVVIDNFSTGTPENLQHIKSSKLTIIEADIADESFNLLDAFQGASYIFHLAALADIVPSVKNPDTYYRANVHGTFRVVEAAKKVDGLKKLQYAASSSCYGIPENYPTKETAEMKPEYPYALTKRLGEEMVLHWGKLYKMPVVSTRFFNVYGPRARTTGTYGAVFGVFLAQKLNGKPFTVVGDGTQTRDFTYVTDLVDAIYRVTISEATNEAFNIGSGGTYSVNKLVELLGGEIVYIPKRPGEPDCTFADISKLKAAIGWEAKTSFEDGVRKMLDSIDAWKDAPVWEPDSIAKETEAWMNALS